VPLAQGDTGGSRVAAQVLLSAFNGEEWQLNIASSSIRPGITQLSDHFARKAERITYYVLPADSQSGSGQEIKNAGISPINR